MIDIFYKTYERDFKWIYHSIASIRKHATGYRRIVIVLPSAELDLFDRSSLAGLDFEIFPVDEYGSGYLYQQWIKMSACDYTDADIILYVDSDCIFDKPVDLRDAVGGKIELYYTDYSKVGDAICWKAPTERFIGREVRHEFMRRNFLAYRRDTLLAIRQAYPDLESMIMGSDAFSEYNAIGAWIYFNDSDRYLLVDTESIESPTSIGRQFWSHSGLDSSDMEEIRRIL